MIRRSDVQRIMGHLPAAQSLPHRPVFLVCTSRCGSTLLYHVMKNHPELAAYPSEANYLWHPKSYPFAKRSIETPPLEVDPKEYTHRSIQSWPNTHRSALRKVFAGFNLMRGRNKTFFQQSAMTSFMVREIKGIFPDAKIVHLVRNGVSVVASMTRKNWKDKFSHMMTEDAYTLHASEYWNQCIHEVREAASELGLSGQEFLEIKYEDLCGDARGTIDSLCGFMGIDPEKTQYDFSKIQSRNSKVGQYRANPDWDEPLRRMQTAMNLLQYQC